MLFFSDFMYKSHFPTVRVIPFNWLFILSIISTAIITIANPDYIYMRAMICLVNDFWKFAPFSWQLRADLPVLLLDYE